MDKRRVFVEEVLLHYDLGQLRGYETVSGGFVSFCLKLSTTKGFFFLREQYPLFNKIRYLNSILHELNEKGFPVAKPIITRNGDSIVKIRNKVFSIYEWVEGDSIEPNGEISPERIVSAAKTLARLHRETIEIAPEHVTVHECRDISHITQLWAGGNSTLSKIERKGEKTTIDKEIIRIIPFVEHQLELLERDLPYVRERPNLSIIHGDFRRGQLIFQENQVAALVDFDDIKLGYSEYDLIKGITDFCQHPRKPELHLGRLESFVRSYKEVYGKIDLEPREVIAFLRHAMLTAIAFVLEKLAFEGQNQSGIEVALYYVKACEWIKKKEKKIIKIFTK